MQKQFVLKIDPTLQVLGSRRKATDCTSTCIILCILWGCLQTILSYCLLELNIVFTGSQFPTTMILNWMLEKRVCVYGGLYFYTYTPILYIV